MLRRQCACLLLCLFVLLLLPCPGYAGAESDGRLTVYFPSWNVYSSDYGQVKDLPWGRFDCVNHAFWKIVPENGGYSLCSADPWADTDEENPRAHFPQYEKYAALYPDTEIMISVGGWTCCGYYSEMAATKEGRASFIESSMEVLEKYAFLSGIDIDWEYPGVAREGGPGDEGNPVKGDDYTNYTLLLRELRKAMDARFGKGEKQLTVCAADSAYTLSRQDYASLHPYVDRVNLMTYDMAGPYDDVTGHASALYGRTSVDSGVKYLQEAGVPDEKIVIGTPLYGHGWKLKAMNVERLIPAPALSSSVEDELWQALAKLEEQAVEEDAPGWHAGYDEDAQAAYLWNDDPDSPACGTLFTYDNSRSLAQKLDYIRAHGLGGIIVWQTGGDDAAAGWPMLNQMFSALHP